MIPHARCSRISPPLESARNYPATGNAAHYHNYCPSVQFSISPGLLVPSNPLHPPCARTIHESRRNFRIWKQRGGRRDEGVEFSTGVAKSGLLGEISEPWSTIPPCLFTAIRIKRATEHIRGTARITEGQGNFICRMIGVHTTRAVLRATR